MFESKTLFVVGAGASAEIGLPVGSALLETIADKLKISFQGGHRQSSGDPDIAEVIRLYVRGRYENQNLYCQKAKMIDGAVTVAPSTIFWTRIRRTGICSLPTIDPWRR